MFDVHEICNECEFDEGCLDSWVGPFATRELAEIYATAVADHPTFGASVHPHDPERWLLPPRAL